MYILPTCIKFTISTNFTFLDAQIIVDKLVPHLQNAAASKLTCNISDFFFK